MISINESLKWHERAKKVIPGGAQTLSKQYGRTVQGIAPPMIEYGDGCLVYDYDDNEYIDWTAALGPIILGYDYFDIGTFYREYGDPDQVLLPMTNHLEVELAEKLIDIIPCAEMVRFFKSGSDATSAAVRLARAISKKKQVICCGYHSWHDWYSSTLTYDRSLGSYFYDDFLTIKVSYGDLVELEYYISRYPACFILEPMNRQCPEKANKEYLQEVRKLCDKYGVILIFDEIIMGFRYAMAGGEEYFGVTPDLACYSKAMANGFPISALVGKKEYMKEIEHLQVSGTFFGELLSVKAALETIKVIEEQNVIEHIWAIGTDLYNRIRNLINLYKLNDIVSIKGWGPWSSLVWSSSEDSFYKQNYFLQEITKNGILYNRDHFSTFSHTNKEVDKTIEVYEGIFEFISENRDKDFKRLLEGKPIDSNLFPG